MFVKTECTSEARRGGSASVGLSVDLTHSSVYSLCDARPLARSGQAWDQSLLSSVGPCLKQSIGSLVSTN